MPASGGDDASTSTSCGSDRGVLGSVSPFISSLKDATKLRHASIRVDGQHPGPRPKDMVGHLLHLWLAFFILIGVYRVPGLPHQVLALPRA